MPHLDNGAFLKQLKSMFDNSQTTGSVYITFKGVLVNDNRGKGTKKGPPATKKPDPSATPDKKEELPSKKPQQPPVDKKPSSPTPTPATAPTAAPKKDEKKPPEKKPQPQQGEYRCLVRASNGKSSRNKVKISTHVKAKDQLSFQLAYNKLLMTNMDALKKREKEKKKKKTKHA